jgi:choline dehydrogenase
MTDRDVPGIDSEAVNGTNSIPGTALPDYEYIVVGSGAGGGPLAARLAIGGHSVLLLEAGDDQGAAIEQQVPAFHAKSTEFSAMQWDYWVRHYADDDRAKKDSKITWETPSGEDYVGPNPPAGSKMKGILYPRAGTLGGCGSHNAMIHIYPHESDWSEIASLTGDSSWAPYAMRKYYERLERCEYVPNSVVGHGFDGWLGVNRAELGIALGDSKILSMIFAAAAALGETLLGGVISTVSGLTDILLRDANSGLPGRDAREGLYQIPLDIAGGKRNGPREFVLETANAVNPDGSRKYRLDIRTHALVTRVRFATEPDADGKPKAIGVDFLDGQSLYRGDPRATGSGGTPGSVNARREVVLAAGAFNTPQLLMLSGIGSKAQLDRFQIPVKVDLPGVGQNLQDRYEAGVVSMTDSDFSATSLCTFNRAGTSDPCLQQWRSNAGGSRGVYGTNGFAVSLIKKSSAAVSNPDLFLFGGPVHFKGYFPGYSDLATADARHWTWAVLKAHTGNRAGTVSLKSADPLDTPDINFNYFDTGTTANGAADADLTAMAEGIAMARKISQSLSPLAAPFHEISPGTGVNTTEAVKEYVKNEAWGHHASCTCPIGADGDPNAVLDSRFRVRGVSGLRVVDASVFPRIPGFFIAVPIYMVSEKAADVILEDAE